MNGRTAATAAAILASVLAASADVIHVDVGGGGDYSTIQEGVDAAAEGDTVLVAPGTYSGTGNCEISFRGMNLVLVSSAGADSTVIDCQGGGTTAILLDAGQDTTSVVCGFTISNASTCVAALSSSPLIQDCIMLHPSEAGVHCESSGAIIRGTEFYGTTWDGIRDNGAFCQSEPGPTLSYCLFDHCERGLDTWFCSPTVRHCDFIECADAKGAGALCRYGSALFEDCLFSECEKNVPWGASGTALRFDHCESVLRRVRFERNGWDFSTNFTTLFAQGESLVLDRVVFWNNPTFNSAMEASVTYYAVSRCTFVGNSGDAIWLSGPGSGTVDSTIIAYNDGTISLALGAEVTTRHSCVFGNADGDSLPGPHLENLFTWPLFCDWEEGNLTLRDDSPCLPDGNPWGAAIGAYGAGDCGSGIDGESVAPGVLRIRHVNPNPADATVTRILITAPPGAEVEVGIFDLRGRLVRTLELPPSHRGSVACSWDHRDALGTVVASGVYFVEASSPAGEYDRAKIVVLR